MTPADIESLLHRGAQRRGCSFDAFRSMVEQIATACNLTFVQGLWCISQYDEDTGKWQRFIEEYQTAQEEAAQIGCSMHQLVEAYTRLNGQTGPPRQQ